MKGRSLDTNGQSIFMPWRNQPQFSHSLQGLRGQICGWTGAMDEHGIKKHSLTDSTQRAGP